MKTYEGDMEIRNQSDCEQYRDVEKITGSVIVYGTAKADFPMLKAVGAAVRVDGTATVVMPPREKIGKNPKPVSPIREVFANNMITKEKAKAFCRDCSKRKRATYSEACPSCADFSEPHNGNACKKCTGKAPSIPIQASCASGVKRWDDLPVNDAIPTMLAALKMFTACKFEDKESLTTAHLFAQSAVAKAEREI